VVGPADAANRKEAAQLFEQGLAAFQNGEFETARQRYAESYALAPHPYTLYNLALTYERLLEHETAIATFERFLAQLPAPTSETAGNSAALRLRNETSRHRLEIDAPDDLPLVPADPVQLDQVFTNLISNSVKYSPAGSIMQIQARREDAGRMRVQVSNESPRVPPEDLARIFDRFHRITHADKVMGTGLGLSICKGIIDAHGGRIWAENRPPQPGDQGRGFIFNITLPLTWNGASPRLPPPETT
jgi:signal transduction histidine kinase